MGLYAPWPSGASVERDNTYASHAPAGFVGKTLPSDWAGSPARSFGLLRATVYRRFWTSSGRGHRTGARLPISGEVSKA